MRERSTIVLGVVALGLLAFILLVERNSVTSGEISERRGRVLERFVRDRVDRVELTRAGGARLVLVKEGASAEGEVGTWKLVEPVQAEADDEAVSSLLFAVDFASARRKLEGIDDAESQQFGLKSPKITATFSIGEERLTVTIGGDEPRGEGVYLATPSAPGEAFVVGRDVLEALDHDADHFRTKEPFGEAAITRARRIELREGSATVVLTKREGLWWLDQPERVLARRSVADELVRAVDRLTIQRFVGSMRELAQPARSLVLELEPPAVADGGVASGDYAPQRLALGGPCEGHTGETLGRVNDGPVVCFRDEDLAPLRVDARAARDPRIVVSEAQEVDRLELVARGVTLRAHREGETWKVQRGDDAEVEAAEDSVDAWLRALHAVEAIDYAPRPDAESAPSATLTLHKLEGGDEVVRLFVLERDAVRGGPTSPELQGLALVTVGRGEEPMRLHVPVSTRALFEPTTVRFRDRHVVDEDPESALRVTVERGGATETVELDGENWRVRAPIAALAERASVRTLVRMVSSLEAVRFESATATLEQGLAAPRFVVRIAYGGDLPEEHVLKIGAETDGGAFAQLDASPEVLVVSSEVVTELRTPLVSRNAMSTAAEDLQRIRITRGATTVELVRDGEIWKTAAGAVADATRTGALVDRIVTLYATGVLGYGAAPEDRSGQATVVVTRRDGAPAPATYTLWLGAPQPDGSVAVSTDAVDARFVIPRESAQTFLDYVP